MNSSRHADSIAAGWPVSRESASRLSPRSRHKTTLSLRFADQSFYRSLAREHPHRYCSMTKCVSRIFEGRSTGFSSGGSQAVAEAYYREQGWEVLVA